MSAHTSPGTQALGHLDAHHRSNRHAFGAYNCKPSAVTPSCNAIEHFARCRAKRFSSVFGAYDPQRLSPTRARPTPQACSDTRDGVSEVFRERRIETSMRIRRGASTSPASRRHPSNHREYAGNRRQTLFVLPVIDGVDTPCVHREQHRAQRAHRVDDHQRARRFRQGSDVLQLIIPDRIRRLASAPRQPTISGGRSRRIAFGNLIEELATDSCRLRACSQRAQTRWPISAIRPLKKPFLIAEHARAFPRESGDRHFHRAELGPATPSTHFE